MKSRFLSKNSRSLLQKLVAVLPDLSMATQCQLQGWNKKESKSCEWTAPYIMFPVCCVLSHVLVSSPKWDWHHQNGTSPNKVCSHTRLHSSLLLLGSYLTFCFWDTMRWSVFPMSCSLLWGSASLRANQSYGGQVIRHWKLWICEPKETGPPLS